WQPRLNNKSRWMRPLFPSTKRSPFFKAFLVMANVPEIYMQEFWATTYVHQHSIRFKMDTRKNIVDLEAFREMLHISPRIKTLTDVNINKLFQPWRLFAAVINKCLTGKSSDFDSLRDDILFSTIKVVSRHQNTQQYGAILPIELTTEDIRNTKAYKEYYACATREAAPKPKASARRKKGGSNSSTTPPTAVASPIPITTVAAAPRLTAATKGKQPARATSLTEPSEVERTEAEQLKIVLRRSRQETHISHHGGFNTNEGTGSKPGVPDVPSDDLDEEISWNSSDEEDVDDQTKGRDDNKGEKTDAGDADDDDQDETEKDDDDDNDNDDEEEIAKHDEQEDTESGEDNAEDTKSDRESEEQETREEEEESFDPIPRTPKDDEDDGNVSQDIEDSHVTLTPVQPDGQQESLSVSSFVTSMLNLISDAGVESSFTTASSPIAPLPTHTHTYHDSFHHCHNNNIKENDEFLRTINENMKKIIKGQVKSQVKEQVSHILPRIKESVNAQLEAEVLTKSSNSSRTSYAVATDLIEMELKKILIEKMEGNKSIQRSDEQRNLYKALVDAYEADKTILESYGDIAILKRRREDDDDQEGPFAGSDRGSTTGTQSRQMSASESAFVEELVQTTCQMDEPPQTGAEDQPIVQTSQHPECLIELEYHLKEVYKATTDQLDWVNPEAQQYPYNLLQPLSLIPDNRGRRVILFAHFINNDLEYLRGGTSSQKYTTSVTKTKAADYGHIKWIEDLVPRTMWIQEPLNYDKHALWGVSYCGRKHLQFYGFTVNRESALDVYSKRRIIAANPHGFAGNVKKEVEMSVHGYTDDEFEPDPNITLISKNNVSNPLHLHHNDSTAWTVVSIKLKGNENYQVWSCAKLLALEGKNKNEFIDDSCRRSNTDEVLGRQWDRVNAVVLGWILNSMIEEFFLG
nr:ribonuclease H-like domain-containing protein [Tanacetum cinerariifolium]